VTRVYIGGRGHGKTAAAREWQELGTAGALTLTPAEDRFWDEATAQASEFGKLSAKVEMTWQDVSDEFMALFMGYSSVEELRAENEKRRQLLAAAERWSEYPIVYKAPDVGEVRWACKRPTAPVYAIGTNGWMLEQYEARLTPAMREHNRKIAAENAAIMDRFATALGVKRNDSRD
jgi:hypothetical protein